MSELDWIYAMCMNPLCVGYLLVSHGGNMNNSPVQALVRVTVTFKFGMIRRGTLNGC